MVDSDTVDPVVTEIVTTVSVFYQFIIMCINGFAQYLKDFQ